MFLLIPFLVVFYWLIIILIIAGSVGGVIYFYLKNLHKEQEIEQKMKQKDSKNY